MTTAQTTGWTAHEDYEGSVEQIAGLPPTEAQQARAGEVGAIAEAVDQHAPLIDQLRADLLAIIAGAVGVTLQSLKSETDALSGILTADDAALDTAQERIDRIKQLVSDVESLAIVDVSGLQGALDGKEPVGVAQGLVTALESTIRGSGAAGESLTSLSSAVDSLSQILSSDDAALDTAQERVDRIKQLIADVDTLAIADIANLQATLDALQGSIDGKEAAGVAQSLVDNIEAAIRGSGAAGVTLASLASDVSALTQLLSSDDAALDTAQERVDKIKQLISEVETLDIADIAGLQGALDTLTNGKENTGVAAALFAELNLNAISETKSLNAVTVSIYDTRNDSDDGAWRYRTQGSSWYQEALNTTTRGSRREISSMPIVVAESSSITLLDSDEPSQAMWKVYEFSGHTITSVSAKNGHLLIGSDLGLTGINLIADTTEFYDTASGPSIADNQVNDIAVTVLDDAPIDPVTGLPVPTIAVATDGGVSVINHDGSVANSSTMLAVSGVEFTDTGDLWYVRDKANYILWYATKDEYQVSGFDNGIGSNLDGYDMRARVRMKGLLFSKGGLSFQSQLPLDSGNLVAGLQRFFTNPSDFSQSMSALITSTYNTGWMGGGNVLTALCSTDTSDLVGSGELVVNGDFSADSDWVKPAGYSISSGSMTYDGSGAQYSKLYQSLSGLTVGKLYAITFTLSGLSAGSLNFGFGTSSAGGFELPQQTYYSDGTYTRYMTASVADHTLMLQNNDATQTFSIDNVSVKLADDDRSVNNKGLIVHGTLNRTVLGDGADMVAYGGSSSTKYLEQPYNPDMDFGTGDFTIEGWVDLQSTGYGALLHRTVDKTGTGFGIILFYFPTGIAFRGNGTTCQTLTYRPVGLTYIAAVRRSGVAYLYINGDEHASISMTNDLTLPDATTILCGYWQGDSVVANGNDRFLNIRVERTAKSADQIQKTYNDEKKFLSNPATLYGTSDQVNAIDHDECTELLHAVTPAGRSVFDGLVRVDNTTTAATVVAAHDGLVVEG